MCRYIFSIALFFLSVNVFAQADSQRNNVIEKKMPVQHQLRLAVDISKPIANIVSKDKSSYELQLDYSLKNDVYFILEGGFGNSVIDYPDLKYNTTNSFARIGFDKSMLQRLFPNDWDMIFVGMRYGVGFIKRSEASFTTNDNFWGVTTGTIPAVHLTAHWAELTGGLRLELLKGFYAGYTIRAKFLLNQSPFRELPPAFVAGFGKIEKTTSFDFNFYLCYAIRW